MAQPLRAHLDSKPGLLACLALVVLEGFVAILDSSLTPQHALKVGGDGLELIRAAASDGASYYLVGSFTTAIDFGNTSLTALDKTSALDIRLVELER